MDDPSIAGMLRTNADRNADRTMFRFLGNGVTWSEHYRRACKVAHAMATEGVGTGSRVAFLDRNGLEYFEVMFGGVLRGAVNVAVNWRLSPAEMAGVIDDSRATVLVVHPEFVPCLAKMESGLPNVSRVVVLGDSNVDSGAGGASDLARRADYEDWLADQPETDPGTAADADDVAMQLYTSGTTGLPKGVMLTNRNMSLLAVGGAETFGISPSTVSLVAMPLFHIGGSGWALAGMSQGGISVIVRDLDPIELLGLVESERITHAFLVPAVLMMLLATPRIKETDLSSLDTIFYGASPISESVLVSCIEVIGCRFSQVYGMTETSGAIVKLDPQDHDPSGPRRHLLRAAGRPLEGVELKIVDPFTRDELARGEVGELITRSRYNMLGYWEKPDDTRSTISDDGWLRTGDAGYIDHDGYLYLHDRIKDMVISGGENIYPAEVENALLEHPDVVDAAVIGVPDDVWGEAVKAFVVRSQNSVGDKELILFCRDRLAHYKCPRTVEFVESLPRNASGKVLKRELRRSYWQNDERQVH